MDEAKRERPDYIWDQATLWRLLEHPSHGVQQWAASHILEFYPEASPQAVQYLPQVSSGVAFHLLSSLQDLPLPEQAAGPLWEFLQGDAEPQLKAKAAALLVRDGKAPSQEDPLPLPDDLPLGLLSDTDPGFQFLVQRYLEAEGPDETLYQAIAQGCGAVDLLNSLQQYSKKQLRRTLRDLANLWEVKLPEVQKVKSHRDALGLLQQSLEVAAGDTLSPQDFPVLSGQLRQSRTRLAALLDATRRREAAGRPVPYEATELLLAGALALCRDNACIRTLASDPTASQLWRVLALRPWREQQPDPALIQRLKRQEPDVALSSLFQVLNSGWGYCSYPLYMLEALKVPGRHELLDHALDGCFGDSAGEEADDTVRDILKEGEALEALLAGWHQQPPEPNRLLLLSRSPTEDVVEFLLQHFEEYMSRPHSARIIDVMGEVASVRFLEPLVQEWREGELLLERTIWYLAELHGKEADERLQRIPRHTEDLDGLLDPQQDMDSLISELRDRPTVLPLRCTSCQRTYRYQLERVVLGKQPGDVTIAQIIQCKGCGSLETYEVTEDTLESLGLELWRIQLLRGSQGNDEPPNTALRAQQRVEVSAAGRQFRNYSEAYHYLEQAVGEDPENAELRRRLGNVLRNGLRPDLSLPHFREAVRLNPRDLDAVYCLADVLVQRERYWEAIPRVEALARLCREPEVDEALSRDAFSGLIELAYTIEQETGHRIDLFPVPGKDIITGEVQGAGNPRDFEVFDLDLNEPEDLEQAYQLFRHGTPIRGRSERRQVVREPFPRTPEPVEPYRAQKVGRNDRCPCGSGRKYKRCCGR